MNKTYWISAKTTDEGKTEHILRFIDAVDFEHAYAQVRKEAREKWPERMWRITSVTEQPDENAGVALMVDIAAAHRGVMAGRTETTQRSPGRTGDQRTPEAERMVPA